MKKLIILLFILPFVVQSQIRQFPDSFNWKKVNTLIAVESGFYIGGLSYLQYIWYSDKERVPFHYYNDNKGWLQMDKYGHAMSSYELTRLMNQAYSWSGLSKNKSMILSASISVGYLSAI